MKKLKTWEKLKNWKYNTYWIITFDITERNDNDEMKWIDNAYYDENELSRLKQTKLVKHGLRDLTAIVHGKYQYTRYTTHTLTTTAA